METGGRAETGREIHPGVLATVVALHLAVFYALARFLAPAAIDHVADVTLAAFSIAREEPPPPAAKPNEAGDNGAAGKKAVPIDVAAPVARLPVKQEARIPPHNAHGKALDAGAAHSGDGTGGGNAGSGAGSGNGGNGQGGGAASKVKLIAGNISNASDYPVPEGGRKARVGTSVIIAVQVDAEGRPTSCAIYRPGPFPETNMRTCELAMRRFRFEPAHNDRGEPVPSVFHWKQDFFN